MLFLILGTDFLPSREDFDVPCDEQLKGFGRSREGLFPALTVLDVSGSSSHRVEWRAVHRAPFDGFTRKRGDDGQAPLQKRLNAIKC